MHDVIVVGGDPRTTARMGYRTAGTFRDALEMASDTVGRSPSITYFHAPPLAIAVPANTLVVADTFGFHARGPSARPTTRVEIWAMGRRNPFLPWAGLDPWTLPALGLRKPLVYWKSVDLLARFGLGRQRWRPRGAVSAFDRA